MGKSLLYMVALFALGCMESEFPREVYIEDSCTVEDEISIAQAIDELNDLGQELLGEDLIAFVGRTHDPDGLGVEDVDDGLSTIYCLRQPDESYQLHSELDTPAGKRYGLMGLGLQNDVALYLFNMDQCEAGDDGCSLPDDWPEGQPAPYGSVDPVELRSIATHELGHFIGLTHVPDDRAVMHEFYDGQYHFRTSDKVAFCCEYSCLADEYDNCSWDEVQTPNDARGRSR